VFLDIGSLIVESRVKRSDCKRGYGEGPHCPTLSVSQQHGRVHHACNSLNVQVGTHLDPTIDYRCADE
jgi:hypothetical protein